MATMAGTVELDMPILDSIMTLEDMKRAEDTHTCSECGAGLSICWGGAYEHDGYALRCSRDPSHEGIERKYWPTIYELAQGVKKMNERALAEYRNRTQLTTEQADEILARFWPKATPDARWKAAMMCHTYGLNPLMSHIALMKFGEQWVVALEIKATRLIARRAGNWSYLDMTPRAATEDEIKKIFGDADMSDRLVSVTKIKDDEGHEATGVGVWRKADKVYGEDKGNTPRNMANIRSERQALDRLFPDAIPVSEVYDASYEVQPDTGNDTGDGNGTGETDDVQQELWETEEAPPPLPQSQEHEIKNPGELMSYCYGKYGIGPSMVLRELNIDTASQIKNLALARQTIDHVYGGK